MARIRVVHVLYSFGTGGLEKGIATLVRHGSPDLEHVIVCLSRSGASAALLPPGTTVVELHKPAGNSLRFVWKLSRALKELRPAVVHTRNWSGLDGIVAARLAGLKSLVHGEHGWGMDDPEGRNPRRVLARRYMAGWVREYTCVSKAMEEWLGETIRVGRPVTQVYNGIDTRRYAPAPDRRVLRRSLGLPEDALIAGVVGRLDPIKDHGTLFRAFDGVRRRFPGARLLVVGDGPEMGRLRGEAGDGIDFLGDRADVAALLPALDLFVLPSLNEGISNTILEAMATGLPVIATRVGGNPELVVDGVTGTLVPPSSAAEVEVAMLRYAGDTELRRAHGEAGRQRAVAGFGIPAMVEGYEQVYRRWAVPAARRRP
ncbi:MAG: glycosyltransferase [Deferrisomatales bacterium]